MAAVLSNAFWREFKKSFQGLDDLRVRKAVLTIERNEPVLLQLEILAEPLGSGVLTKTYALVEQGADEEGEVSSLDDTVQLFALPLGTKGYA